MARAETAIATAVSSCHRTRMIKVLRDKLPKGWAYPLKASVLDEAIAQAGIGTPVTLFLHHGAFWSGSPLFTANFYLAGSGVLNEEEVFWVSCRSVVASDCRAARTYVDAEAIPEFVAWAAELERLPMNSTRRMTQGIVRDLPAEDGE